MPLDEKGEIMLKFVDVTVSYHYPEYPVNSTGPDKVSVSCPNYEEKSHICGLSKAPCSLLEKLMQSLKSKVERGVKEAPNQSSNR
jgi:hypothetical protein